MYYSSLPLCEICTLLIADSHLQQDLEKCVFAEWQSHNIYDYFLGDFKQFYFFCKSCAHEITYILRLTAVETYVQEILDFLRLQNKIENAFYNKSREILRVSSPNDLIIKYAVIENKCIHLISIFCFDNQQINVFLTKFEIIRHR